ncbi:hypothetical protein RZS08_22120, partial [Arthrospira platensis SPKY1]|nr:hypothetical protein [Arthrospira platensis SPKY1]
ERDALGAQAIAQRCGQRGEAGRRIKGARQAFAGRRTRAHGGPRRALRLGVRLHQQRARIGEQDVGVQVGHVVDVPHLPCRIDQVDPQDVGKMAGVPPRFVVDPLDALTIGIEHGLDGLHRRRGEEGPVVRRVGVEQPGVLAHHLRTVRLGV